MSSPQKIVSLSFQSFFYKKLVIRVGTTLEEMSLEPKCAQSINETHIHHLSQIYKIIEIYIYLAVMINGSFIHALFAL